MRIFIILVMSVFALVFAVEADFAGAVSLTQNQTTLSSSEGDLAAAQEPTQEKTLRAGCGVKSSDYDEDGIDRTNQLAAEMEECPAGSGKRCPVGTRCHCDSKGCFCVSKPPWK